MEVCTTLGMLTPEQAKELRQAGLTAYNHNLDTSPEYYEKVGPAAQLQVVPGVPGRWGGLVDTTFRRWGRRRHGQQGCMARAAG